MSNEIEIATVGLTLAEAVEVVRANNPDVAPAPHRCPHFQPKGEDSGGAYNAGIIQDVSKDLLDPLSSARLSAKPTAWYSLLIKQLIQRIANLRVMLSNAEHIAPTGDAGCEWKLTVKDSVWTTSCDKATYYTENLHPRIMNFCPFCGKEIK